MQQIDPTDPTLRSLATARQREILDAIAQHGSQRKAAKALGVHHHTVFISLKGLLARASIQGYSPQHDMTKVVPEPFVLRGTSTLYDKDGKLKLQWVKSKRSDEIAEQLMRDFIASIAEDIRGRSPKIEPPKISNEDLLAVYPIGDPHFGMYAWGEESGESFDLKIADSLTRSAIDRLVDASPDAQTGIVISLGDTLHADNNYARTPQNGNALDVDSRWYKTMRVAKEAIRYCVLRALKKHQKVIVRVVQGNHDPHAAIGLALIMQAHFENNPRVTVDLSPSLYWYYEFGNVLLGVTHGDTCKVSMLPGEMAAGHPQAWGRTKFRHWLRGHVHHSEVEELQGCMVESFRTLAPRDAWHAGQGYRAGRDMYCIVYHREFGEIERHRCDVAMLQAPKV